MEMSSEPLEPNRRKMRLTYTREFLLSVGELEACKRLPAGFDSSILSELQEVSAGVLERSRGHYGAPMGRSDGSGGYSSRGGNSGGRWDTRSSGSSDRDGDLPEQESFPPDRHPRNQYKRSWQNTEHDGLLGSGAFPRPAGYTGPLASKDRGSGYQLNRSSERYQPPRPYKAVPFSRKDIDSINDETFGSFECSNDERTEEERKRRASFELMRKEQHKALQEKKSAPDSGKENLGDDIISLLRNSAEKTGPTTKSERPDESTVHSAYQEDAAKISSAVPASTTRPLVPPGFSNALVEKKLQTESSSTSLESEARNLENFPIVARFDGQAEGKNSASSIISSKSKAEGISDNIANVGPRHPVPLSSEGAMTSVEYASATLQASGDWEDDSVDKYSIGREGKSKNMKSISQDNSISILEQFFGNALSKSSSSLPTYVESQQSKKDEDVMVSSAAESSKFARWFLDEDARPAEDLSTNGLLSMIVKNENLCPENMVPSPPVSGGIFENLSPKSSNSLDAASKLPTFTSVPAVGIVEQYSCVDLPEPVPVMMTCEDLEQTMLAQVDSTGGCCQKNPIQEHQTVLDEPSTVQDVVVDHASQHLLSLLQKGAKSKGSSPQGFHTGSVDEPQSFDLNGMVHSGTAGTAPVNKPEAVPTSGKSLTLEALFGAAFMNELHSMNAPVSARASTAGVPNHDGFDISSSQRLPYVDADKTLFSSNPEEYSPNEQTLPFVHIKDGAAPMEPGTGIEHRNSAFLGSIRSGASFEEKGSEIQLPEEDNLFTVNDSLDARNPDLLPLVKSGRVEGLLPEKAAEDLSYRLQNLMPGDAEHIQLLGPDSLGSHSRDQRYQVDSQNLYHLLQGRPPAQAPHPMQSARPELPLMDHIASRNQQSPFNMPEAIQHGPHLSFRPNNMSPIQHALHAPSGPHLDPATRHLMLQHMSMPGSFPSQFPPQGLPRGVPQSQPMHVMPGYRPEMSNVNSFNMHPRQPSYGEFGMTMSGLSSPAAGGSNPEALERWIQMELRARSKQIHPAMAGPAPGIYGTELDMNFRYR